MLLVLDAGDMTELARAEISRAVPPGFHGNFVRSH
jgi:carotenoid cleavage dioxygenase-like enzyme